jgi:hypothetical protein
MLRKEARASALAFDMSLSPLRGEDRAERTPGEVAVSR